MPRPFPGPIAPAPPGAGHMAPVAPESGVRWKDRGPPPVDVRLRYPPANQPTRPPSGQSQGRVMTSIVRSHSTTDQHAPAARDRRGPRDAAPRPRRHPRPVDPGPRGRHPGARGLPVPGGERGLGLDDLGPGRCGDRHTRRGPDLPGPAPRGPRRHREQHPAGVDPGRQRHHVRRRGDHHHLPQHHRRRRRVHPGRLGGPHPDRRGRGPGCQGRRCPRAAARPHCHRGARRTRRRWPHPPPGRAARPRRGHAGRRSRGRRGTGRCADSRLPGHADLHLGDDRASQGRGAHPRQLGVPGRLPGRAGHHHHR